MIRDPYVSGVERFAAPVDAPASGVEPALLQRQIAYFCQLAWQEFASDLRLLRYSRSFARQPDVAVEYQQMPTLEELSAVDLAQASQIDLEFISQQPAIQQRRSPLHAHEEEDYFPAFLEIFLSLAPSSSQHATALARRSHDRLVIWCRPVMIKQVLALWGRAANLSLEAA